MTNFAFDTVFHTTNWIVKSNYMVSLFFETYIRTNVEYS